MMDMIGDVFETSSSLTDELSLNTASSHRTIVRNYLDKKLTSKGIRLPADFKSGLDWLNVKKELSFAKELKGKLVVLDFFTYCCINCMHILPQLKALEHQFSVEDGLVVIGVHSPKFPNERSTANVEAAVKRYEITHPVVNDHDEHLWTALGICCWPTLAVIGPDGELLLFLLGESHEELLRLFVEESLSILKAKHAVSSHSIPEIGVEHQYRSTQQLCFPGKICVTEVTTGLLIAVADTGNHRILVLDQSGHVQFTVGGGESGFKNGSFEEARFHAPQGMVFTDPHTLYVADTENHAIRKVDLKLGVVETVVGDGSQGEEKVGGGVGLEQRLSSPWDLAVLDSGVLLIAMAGSHQIWAYFMQDTTFWKNKQYAAGCCAAVVGSGREANRNNAYPQSAGLAQPSGLTLSADQQTLFVADSESSTIRAVSTLNGKVTGLVGGLQDPQNLFAFGDVDGCGLEARLQHPLGVAWSEHNQSLYVCDSYNHKVKVINPSSRHCSTLTGTSLKFNEPGGLFAISNLLYVADTNNHCIRVINLDDYSVETMQLTFKKSGHKEKKILEPLKEERITINSSGGVLELSISVNCASDIKPLEESPAVWTLDLPERWRENITAGPTEGIGRRWTMYVPAEDSQSTSLLRPQCRLFYCRDSLCHVQVLPFLVTVAYSDTASAQVFCTLQHQFCPQ